MPFRPNRRHFLQSGLAAAAVWPAMGNLRAHAFEVDPFALGVASGTPTPDSIVLWTRLLFPASEPVNVADPFARVETVEHPDMDVAWEIAHDENFARPVQSGLTVASARLAHSVHVQVKGLEPDRWYFYRFRSGDAESRVGRTRSAPAFDSTNGRFSFAFASCQQFEQGWYTPYRHMAERELDLVVHLGDYIYEKSYGAEHVRSHGTGAPTLLYEYRDRYALYKADPDLQLAHARFPWLVTWDDHEVVDNYSGSLSPTDRNADSFLRRRAAAYQAWYEHMPVPPVLAKTFDDLRIYGHHKFGSLLDVTMLDTRQYRSPPVGDSPAIPANLSLLGANQERWFNDTMAAPTAQWSIIAQPTLLSERDLEPGSAERFGQDGWDHYRASRDRLLQTLRRGAVRNPIVIGGDLHAFYAADVHAPDDGALVASEFVTGSITSNPPSAKSLEVVLAENPHIKFGNAHRHGYSVLHLDAKQARSEMIAVSDRKDPDAGAAAFQEFIVLDGHPGVIRA